MANTYPLRLYRTPGPDSVVVNTGDEEDTAHQAGYSSELPAHDEFPKALYLHPVDKTHEHKCIVVQTPGEMDKALSEGYKVEPHVPQVLTGEEYEQGSGSEKYGASDWTAAGQDSNGFPVPKDSAEDVS